MISTDQIIVTMNKVSTLFKIVNKKTNQTVIESVKPIQFEEKSVILNLKENPTEYFYGGGVQNGLSLYNVVKANGFSL